MGSGNGRKEVFNKSQTVPIGTFCFWFTYTLPFVYGTVPGPYTSNEKSAATKVAKIDELPTFTHLLYLSNLIPTN